MLFSVNHTLTRDKLILRICKLYNSSPGAWSFYLPPGSPDNLIAPYLKQQLTLEQTEDCLNRIDKSSTGSVILWGEAGRYLIEPPFPVPEPHNFDRYEVKPLQNLLETERTIAVILVRLGSYAIGIFKGEMLISSKVGTGNVHQRHRQGGSSSHRFERHREKQMEYFFTRIETHAKEHLVPVTRELNYLVYGGNRFTILALLKQSDFLRRFNAKVLPHRLNIREPHQATLEAAISEIYSSQIIEFKTTADE